MKYAILTAIVAGMVLGTAPMTSYADQHKGSESKDRAQDQAHVQQQEMDRLHDKERIRQEERLRPEDEKIYGHKLMSPEELNQYRERLRLMKTEEEKTRFEAQHREEMQKRARALNVELEDAE